MNKAVTRIVKHFDLTNPVEVAKDNGTVTGTPSFSRAGLDFNGTTDYVKYNVVNSLFYQNKISIVIEFRPDFNYDFNDYIRLFDTDAVDFALEKSRNAFDNRLEITLGGNMIAVDDSNYSAYWKQNQRNVIIISGTNGDTSVWLNGTKIVDSDATTWSPKSVSGLSIGAAYSEDKFFNGEIKSLSIYNDILTDDEASSLCDGASLFNFQNKAILWLDMETSTSDGTNKITLDKSGKGNDFKLGDGTTTAYMPAFINPGFYFDGVNRSLSNYSLNGLEDLTELSIAIKVKPYFKLTELVSRNLIAASGGTSIYRSSSAARLRFHVNAAIIAFYTPAELKGYWNDYGDNTIVASFKSGCNNIWINGKHLLVDGGVAWSSFTISGIHLFAASLTVTEFKGNGNHVSIYNQVLTPTQARAITHLLERIK